MSTPNVITDCQEITKLLTADLECQCKQQQERKERAQFNEIVEFISGSGFTCAEDLAEKLLDNYRMESI